jgi:hypothetical protein
MSTNVSVGILATLKAKPGKEKQVESRLGDAVANWILRPEALMLFSSLFRDLPFA